MTTIELNRNKPKRREKLVIMTEIVVVAMKGASKTQIMYKANLSYSILKRYLSLLSHHNLLNKFTYDGREIYKTTPKGIEFMKRQQQIIHLLNQERYRTSMIAYPA